MDDGSDVTPEQAPVEPVQVQDEPENVPELEEADLEAKPEDVSPEIAEDAALTYKPQLDSKKDPLDMCELVPSQVPYVPPPAEPIKPMSDNQVGDDKEDKPKKKSSIGKMIFKFIGSLGGVSILLLLYLIAGGYLFIYFEHPLELREKEILIAEVEKLNISIEFMASYLTDLHYDSKARNSYDNCSGLIDSEYYDSHSRYAKACPASANDKFCNCTQLAKERFADEAESAITKMVNLVVKLYDENGYTGDVNDWTEIWNLANSVFFCLNSLTLIGYGNFTPRTESGMQAFLVYAIFGLPVVMIFLAQIGGAMSDSIKWTWSRVACRCCRIWRRYSEHDDQEHPPDKVSDDLVGKEDYMPTDDIAIPLTVTGGIMFLFVILGGYVFAAWEDWDLLTSCYFTFITLTTIGFGDYVPGSASFKGGSSGGSKREESDAIMKTVATTLYCLLGLALISMGISLAMDEIVRKITAVSYDLGLKETEEEKKRYIIKKSVGVKETPNDKNGNKKTFNFLRKKKKKLECIVEELE